MALVPHFSCTFTHLGIEHASCQPRGTFQAIQGLSINHVTVSMSCDGVCLIWPADDIASDGAASKRPPKLRSACNECHTAKVISMALPFHLVEQNSSTVW